MPTQSTFTPWLFGVRSNPGARMRLFCFPHAGGGASNFRFWADLLPPEIEVCPVQLPGRENRIKDVPFIHFSTLVEALAEQLSAYFTLPFAFFGHSMGALLSYGLASHLQKMGKPMPIHLFASAYRAPHLPNDECLHELPEPALIDKLHQLSEDNRGILENEELRELLLPLFRADFAVCESFVFGQEEPLACPISAFGGLQDERVGRTELAAWREETRSIFSLRMLPGDHFYWRIMPVPLLQAIAHDLDLARLTLK